MVRMLCYAKLNLTLDVTAKRPDGYHELDSIFHTVSIYDRITLSQDPVGYGIKVRCNKPIQGENIVKSAAKIFFQVAGIEPSGLLIDIEKNIPIQAGMGGGSADAAGVLLGLCTLFNVEISPSRLHKAALYLGADVPFLLTGGTAVASGIGEKLYPIANKETLHFIVVKPQEGLSTRAHMIEKKDLTLSAVICRTIRYLELCREKLQEESIIQRWQNLYEKEEEDCL